MGGSSSSVTGKSSIKVTDLSLWMNPLPMGYHLDFPGGPVVGTPCFHFQGTSLIPGQRARIPHIMQYWRGREEKGAIKAEIW